jgi:hypothetical protein
MDAASGYKPSGSAQYDPITTKMQLTFPRRYNPIASHYILLRDNYKYELNKVLNLNREETGSPLENYAVIALN